jgi:gluconate 5-dehydrogenase
MKNDIFSMEGKVVVFTGGGGNLGRPLVKKLLEYGATVAVPERADTFDETFDEYKKADKLFYILSDLSSTDSIKETFATIFEKYGKIDVLVNCAAYGGGAGGKSCEFRIDKISDETWLEGVDGSLNVIFRCTREGIPYFDK